MHLRVHRLVCPARPLGDLRQVDRLPRALAPRLSNQYVELAFDSGQAGVDVGMTLRPTGAETMSKAWSKSMRTKPVRTERASATAIEAHRRRTAPIATALCATGTTAGMPLRRTAATRPVVSIAVMSIAATMIAVLRPSTAAALVVTTAATATFASALFAPASLAASRLKRGELGVDLRQIAGGHVGILRSRFTLRSVSHLQRLVAIRCRLASIRLGKPPRRWLNRLHCDRRCHWHRDGDGPDRAHARRNTTSQPTFPQLSHDLPLPCQKNHRRYTQRLRPKRKLT